MTRRNRCLRILLAAGFAVIAAAALSTGVWAAIQTAAGQMTKIAPPPSVEFNQLESDTTQFAFDERQCVTLAANLKVNITTPGTYDEVIDLTPGVIPAGTRVSSHFVNADKVGLGLPRIELEGTLTTDAAVLGIIIRQGALDNSDFLGAIGTVYPTFDFGRALKLGDGQNDFVILDAGLHSVTVHTDNAAHADQVRVITECKLPDNGGSEGCTPGYWKQSQHFDSWVGYVPTDTFNTVFGVTGPFSNALTLLDALGQGGGGVNALGRHAVAALLASANSGVDYGMTTAEVIALTKAALDSGDANLIEGTKNKLAALNERGCPLN
jgi:hypothetical protein